MKAWMIGLVVLGTVRAVTANAEEFTRDEVSPEGGLITCQYSTSSQDFFGRAMTRRAAKRRALDHCENDQQNPPGIPAHDVCQFEGCWRESGDQSE